MQISMSDTEIDLSGTPLELREIGQALKGMTTGLVREFVAEANADPSPYDRLLLGLRVVASSGQVRIEESGSWLAIEGETGKLSALASWFMFPEDAKFPAHGHYEWYPGHTEIAKDSRPLVISVAK